MESTTHYVIKIECSGSITLPDHCYLAGGMTWDAMWYTNQLRHPEEKRRIYKTAAGAEKRANELRANGVICTVVPAWTVHPLAAMSWGKVY
jgi:hypothetical protein